MRNYKHNGIDHVRPQGENVDEVRFYATEYDSTPTVVLWVTGGKARLVSHSFGTSRWVDQAYAVQRAREFVGQNSLELDD